MNIDWDQELAEYFQPVYLKEHKKIGLNQYQITTLEGSLIQFECSIEGYTCSCHQNKYELPMGLLKAHSKLYITAFNNELNLKLQALADLQ
jgi:hypothetical protein